MLETHDIAKQLEPMLASPLHDGTVDYFEFDTKKGQMVFDVQLSCDSNDELGWFGRLVFYEVTLIRSTHPTDSEFWRGVTYGGIIDTLYRPELDKDGKQGVFWVMDLRFLDNHSEQAVLEFVSSSFTWHPDRSKPSPYMD